MKEEPNIKKAPAVIVVMLMALLQPANNKKGKKDHTEHFSLNKESSHKYTSNSHRNVTLATTLTPKILPKRLKWSCLVVPFVVRKNKSIRHVNIRKETGRVEKLREEFVLFAVICQNNWNWNLNLGILFNYFKIFTKNHQTIRPVLLKIVTLERFLNFHQRNIFLTHMYVNWMQ